ncbi:hypothetical protein JOE09_002364 [Pantoea coffeiphila]|nr:hypothetical protein [Pantoea coffeiphila]
MAAVYSWLVVPPVGRSSRRFAVPSLRSSAGRIGLDGRLQSQKLALAGCAPGRAVLAPLCGALTSLVSQTDRFRRLFAKSEVGAGWLCPRSGGPRAALRYLHFARQPDRPAQTRVLRGCAFRPRPCGRILASSLRSALRIARPGAQPACYLTSALSEEQIPTFSTHSVMGIARSVIQPDYCLTSVLPEK